MQQNFTLCNILFYMACRYSIFIVNLYITSTTKTVNMKVFCIILLSKFVLLFMFTDNSAYAQTVAIGHVSAEIVESVSASSQAITGFNLKNGNTQNAVAQYEESNLNYENVNLGKFKINSGSDIACNFILKSATLSDGNGNGFILEPSATVSGQSVAQRTYGIQTLQLKGKARLMQGQASGLYQGSYTMVIAYN